MKHKQRQRAATARHEAGHAVAHVHFGIPFVRVHIHADKSANRLGMIEQLPVEFRHPLDSAQMLDVEHRIIRAFAGPIAEARFTGRLQWKYGSDDFHSAFQLAAMRFDRASLDDIGAFLKYCFGRAENFIDLEHVGEAVESVSQKLLECGELTEQQCREIVADFGATESWIERFRRERSWEPARFNFAELLVRQSMRLQRRGGTRSFEQAACHSFRVA